MEGRADLLDEHTCTPTEADAQTAAELGAACLEAYPSDPPRRRSLNRPHDTLRERAFGFTDEDAEAIDVDAQASGARRGEGDTIGASAVCLEGDDASNG